MTTLPADLLAMVVAAPAPSDGEEMNSVTVSPGLPGFIATFVLAVLVLLLVLDMVRRTRRIQAQARVDERMREQDGQLPADGGAQERADHGAGDDGSSEGATAAERSSVEEPPPGEGTPADPDRPDEPEGDRS